MARSKQAARSNALEAPSFRYDVALSFAGENRAYVDKVATHLRENGVKLFYDDYERIELWGLDLYEHLHEVYSKMARYCVLFASAAYESKVWTSHERRAAQVRALNEKQRGYILPARFDGTPIPGLAETIGYLNLADLSPLQLADMIIGKIGGFQRRNFLPEEPDRLYEALGATTKQARKLIGMHTQRFFESVTRMSEEERRVVLHVLLNACPVELPDNLHISLDLLRRETQLPSVRIRELLTDLQSVGVYCSDREGPPGTHEDHHWKSSDRQLIFEYNSLLGPPFYEPTTRLAHAVVDVLSHHYCREHLPLTFVNADFGVLSSKVSSRHVHADQLGHPQEPRASTKKPASSVKSKPKRKRR